MFGSEVNFFTIGMDVLITLLTVSLLLCFGRLFIGPSVLDRTVTFDTIAIHAAGIIALFSVRTASPVLADATIIIAVLGFLGTVMLARYWEQSDDRSQ